MLGNGLDVTVPLSGGRLGGIAGRPQRQHRPAPWGPGVSKRTRWLISGQSIG